MEWKTRGTGGRESKKRDGGDGTGMGNRKEEVFGGNLGRRMKLFDRLVGSLMGFEAEIWGWRE